ncbi:unnamed protein product [Hydatigera taeniaeformis]|uniref:Uncharacterized protein n=1 Tax=Hydatigena taeniaeformis TaxID=6205 RepID=A0A3P7ESJ4_HYDTA|nr:unnamed protein product [Hydatigera taeniaeformis]
MSRCRVHLNEKRDNCMPTITDNGLVTGKRSGDGRSTYHTAVENEGARSSGEREGEGDGEEEEEEAEAEGASVDVFGRHEVDNADESTAFLARVPPADTSVLRAAGVEEGEDGGGTGGGSNAGSSAGRTTSTALGDSDRSRFAGTPPAFRDSNKFRHNCRPSSPAESSQHPLICQNTNP